MRRMLHCVRGSRFILWCCIGALTACGPLPPPVPQKQAQELVIAMRPGPTTWFVGPEGAAAGLDRDLADLFAKELGLALRVISVENPWQLIDETSNGEAHIGAGGLYQPVNSSGAGPVMLLFTRGYYAIEPVLVYNTDGFKPESWK